MSYKDITNRMTPFQFTKRRRKNCPACRFIMWEDRKRKGLFECEMCDNMKQEVSNGSDNKKTS